MSDRIYPLSAARALALRTQRLDAPRPTTPESLYDTVEQLGCVQIDTLHLIHRSQYITLWSRHGAYDPALLDQVAFGTAPDRTDRRLFEYWLKEACLIPLGAYRYRLRMMRAHSEGNHRWGSTWIFQPGNKELVGQVLQRVQQEGALRSADFEHDGKRGSWWDWKPAKRALEHLYNTGELMISHRAKFQRVYDLRERVLPTWVDTTEPDDAETIRCLLARSFKALGICTPQQAADAVRIRRPEAKPVYEAMIAQGELAPVKVESANGKNRTMVVHRDILHLLEQAADGAIMPEHTTFLSPFDNLFWATDRDMQLWNFDQVLEAYKPEPLRKWGYFCLPILHRDRLVGRFDPKLERKEGVLRLKALYLEPEIKPDARLVKDVANAMRDFMKFHQATELRIERSQPKEFGTKLLKAL